MKKLLVAASLITMSIVNPGKAAAMRLTNCVFTNYTISAATACYSYNNYPGSGIQKVVVRCVYASDGSTEFNVYGPWKSIYESSFAACPYPYHRASTGILFA